MDANNLADIGLVFFLFGVFCAYWAQTTHRNAWLWFIFGWVTGPLAGVVLLYKNSRTDPAVS